MVSRSARSLTAEVDSVLGPPPASYSQPEVVVLRFRSHGRRIVLPVLWLVGVAVVAGYWVGRLPELWMNVTAGAAAIVLGCAFGVLPILGWLAGRTTVTTRRVIVRRGLFVRHRSELPLARVREVRQRKSLGQRLWGTGSIELLHGAERLLLENVPGAAETTEAMQELMERSFAYESRLQRASAERLPGPGTPGMPTAPGMPGATHS
ncbi:PH domain-containing protein [Leucobacter luti]|uniref:PH domain-containing protein n=1 Tax=Leucobacter luti TaxID=340320 RepID=UPI00215D8BFB|nr:PH domain-containing protein [Leucobacter luti]